MENRAERDGQPAGLPRRGERREAARSNPAPEDASEASVQGSTGVYKDRGMRGEKRNDDRPAGGGALNSGRLVPTPFEEIYLQRINDFQLKEGSAKGTQESDLSIVVRGGSTDHTAKEQAGMQSGQSTHATRGTNTLDSGVSSTLAALGAKAGKDPGHRFRSLARLLDRQMLGEDLSVNNPIMVVVPFARIPEEPGAVIPHAGICEGGVGHRRPYLNLQKKSKNPRPEVS